MHLQNAFPATLLFSILCILMGGVPPPVSNFQRASFKRSTLPPAVGVQLRTDHCELKMTEQLTFNLMPDRKTFTVSELTGKIRDLLVKNFTDISVQGEISNCREAQSGHIYFTLKDDRAQVRCVYFKQQQRVRAARRISDLR